MRAFLLAVTLGILAISAAAEARQPNILLLVSDDQRPDTIAALGNKHLKTPHLDELAHRGVVFTRATCAHPLCFPSRGEMLTGMSGFRSGCFSQVALNDGVALLPQTLHDAGYHTWYVGKWHTAGRPSERGYEECDGLYGSGTAADTPYVDFRGRPATGYRGWQFQTDDGRRMPEKGIGLTPDISAEFADAAICFINRKPEKPFFLHVNFTAPHDPRLWPSNRRPATDKNGLPPLPVNFLPEHPFDHGNARGRDEVLLPFPRTEGDVRQELACYYAVIQHMDEQIGRILAALDETGQRENTLVVFTSDHGLAIGSHGLVGKQNMYEHTINVPLIISGPSIPSGKQISGQCYLRDLFPTFCDLADIQSPKEIDGLSLLPLITGETKEIHPFIVGYFQDSQRMIRDGDWKLIWYPKIDRQQLFNVRDDPHELSDLSHQQAQGARLADLRDKLVRWRREHGDPLIKSAQ